jgi:hypothetical protein
MLIPWPTLLLLIQDHNNFWAHATWLMAFDQQRKIPTTLIQQFPTYHTNGDHQMIVSWTT